MELKHNGKATAVTYETRAEFVDLSIKKRLGEASKQVRVVVACMPRAFVKCLRGCRLAYRSSQLARLLSLQSVLNLLVARRSRRCKRV